LRLPTVWRDNAGEVASHLAIEELKKKLSCWKFGTKKFRNGLYRRSKAQREVYEASAMTTHGRYGNHSDCAGFKGTKRPSVISETGVYIWRIRISPCSPKTFMVNELVRMGQISEEKAKTIRTAIFSQGLRR
jgi:hypothetical protein